MIGLNIWRLKYKHKHMLHRAKKLVAFYKAGKNLYVTKIV